MKIEYKILDLGPFDLEDTLNKLGAEGWELVDRNGDRYIFMRKPGPIFVFNNDRPVPAETFDNLRDILGDEFARLT